MADSIKNKPALNLRTPNAYAVNVVVTEYLVKMTRLGVYGDTPNDVARTLLYDAIRRKLKSGELSPIDPEPDRHEQEADFPDS